MQICRVKTTGSPIDRLNIIQRAFSCLSRPGNREAEKPVGELICPSFNRHIDND